ncbi:MAG: hypothetical protein J5J06_07410 [Phycisphaerae bacterium]|nr:hypothetical protein [Phycisphaerae bacterium]
MNDMVKITCLIIRDGDEHRFIHKSVQEYYAAAYVQKRPGPWAQKFYARLAEKRADDRWGQELEFLSEIDKYRFGRHYLVPAICSFLGINEGQLDSVCPTCTTEMAPHIIDGIGFSQDRQSRKWYGNGIILGARVPPARKARSLLQATQTLVDLDDKILDDVRSQALAQWGNIEKGRYSDVFSTEALVKIPEIRDRLLKGLNAVFQELFAEARAVRQSLRKEEEPTILEGLI